MPEVQARGGFVQHVDGAAVGALPAVRPRAHALRFTAGERGGRLAQADVAQSHFDQGVEIARNRGERREELGCLFDGHVQDFRDVLALVVNSRVSRL